MFESYEQADDKVLEELTDDREDVLTRIHTMTANHINNTTVAIYKSHTDAESAVKELQHAGFDLSKLSIVRRDYHTDERVIGYYNAGDRIRYWGSAGAFWGGIWGLLFGSAFLMVPLVGPLLVAGPFVSSIVSALEGALVMGGFSAVSAALYSLGIPKDSILRYETAIKTGKFVLIAHGTVKEVSHAREIIGDTAAEAYEQTSCGAIACESTKHSELPAPAFAMA